ncbi:hypothetical protein N0V95_009613 [Ascochyta clinopodiicola]|nr:hypothetical protein N0V95_009613 [Ascochyta clinopodiicola]
MYFSTAVIAAFAAAYVSASPLMVRGNTCGAAPAGSNTNNQPILQPSGIQTSATCQSQCEANSSCKSFCFGLVDNTIECKLYSCVASAVPTQSSTNLVVYDKGCSAVPSVVPTSSNPTGKKIDNSQSNTSFGSKTSEQKATESEQIQASNDNYGSQKQTEQSSKQEATYKESTQKQSSSKISTSANTCGTKPSASTTNKPILAPSVISEDACKAKCQANSTCKSFTCGEVDSKVLCNLYSVAAAQVPAPTNAAQKNALKAYDIGCSV